MKFLKATIKNFGSYESTEFNFDTKELTLIYGQTGSGKSTLQDIISWVLFGITSKNGSADEVISWHTPQGELTEGTLDLLINNQEVTVHRERKAAHNDLWYKIDGVLTRGKSTKETQELFNQYTGLDGETYLAGACYNEFSPTGNFFSANAENRRKLFDKIADLTIPNIIQERSKDETKKAQTTLQALSQKIDRSEGRLETLKRTKEAINLNVSTWHVKHRNSLVILRNKIKNFETEKEAKIKGAELNAIKFEEKAQARLDTLNMSLKAQEQVNFINKPEPCPTCGNLKDHDHEALRQIDIINLEIVNVALQRNPYVASIEIYKEEKNLLPAELELAEKQENPHIKELGRVEAEIAKVTLERNSTNDSLGEISRHLVKLGTIKRISSELRTELLRSTIKYVQDHTNALLTRHFESEILTSFTLNKKDSLEVTLMRNGHECSYRQLSKGQRTLLKLCFTLGIMKAASNKTGTHFDTILFDESLSGLDPALKIKAYDLFVELTKSHESIFIIEHEPTFQTMFDNKVRVVLKSDKSHLVYE